MERFQRAVLFSPGMFPEGRDVLIGLLQIPPTAWSGVSRKPFLDEMQSGIPSARALVQRAPKSKVIACIIVFALLSLA